jgi:hypothetical protein
MPRSPSDIVVGQAWFKRFRRKANDFFYWEDVAKQGEITEIWTEAMKGFHENKGYKVRCRGTDPGELSGIDITVFDKNNSEAQIAIELQHWWPDTLNKDLPKLACSNAPLKILMTKLRDDEDMENLKNKVLDIWQKRSDRVKNDELLMLLAITKSNIGEGTYTYVRVEGYLSKHSQGWIKLKSRILYEK